MDINIPHLPYILGYMALGFCNWLLVDNLPGGHKARRYVVLEAVTYAGFVGILYVFAGVVPLFMVVFVVIAFVINSVGVRFCGACGAIRRRRARGGPCKRCGYDKFVSLRTALTQDFASVA